MTIPVPKIDQRTAGDIARQVIDLLAGKEGKEGYAPDWREYVEISEGQKQATGVSGALIGVFARFGEIIIQRLNQAPQKNFLGFLDLLGASLLPPQPARVPLNFSLAAGSAVDGLVPAGTQVAAPPAEGEKDPVIFETERELTVAAAQLVALFVRDPEQDKQADLSSIVATASASGERVFQGNRPIEHILYLGHSRLLGFRQIAGLRLLFTLEATVQDARELRWELWDGGQWRSKTPSADGTQNLTRTGNIAFGATIPIPELPINEVQNRWLRGRVITPITVSSEVRLNMVRATELPKARQVLLEVHLLRALSDDGLSAEAAFTNAVPVDLGKDFFPFGEKPKVNDVLYLASAEAFSKDRAQGLAPTGASVQLDVQVGNSHLRPAAASARPSPDLQLVWECWNGGAWQHVGASNAPPWLRLLEVDPPPEVTAEERVTVQGRVQRGAVVRAEIFNPTGGPALPAVKIGDGRFATSVSLSAGLNVISLMASLGGNTTTAWATFFREVGQNTRNVELTVQSPPEPVTTGSIDLVVNATGALAGRVNVIRFTNGSNGSQQVSGPKGSPLLINLLEGRNELLIEGLSAPTALPLAATTLTVSREASPPPPEAGTGFVDGTHAFCQSGIVRFTLPDQVARVAINGQESFWLRVRLIRETTAETRAINSKTRKRQRKVSR